MFSLRALTAVVLISAACCTFAEPTEVQLEHSPNEPSGSDDEAPILIEADKIKGNPDEEIDAEGNVEVRKQDQAIWADTLHYSVTEEEVDAKGNVRIESKGTVVEGTRLKLNLETERGFIDNPDYDLREPAGRGEAEQFLFEGPNQYRAKDASYTTCPIGQDDWYLRAGDLKVDRDRQVGVARDARLDFLGVPILYTPYIDFSLTNERKSGFLSPSLGTTESTGFDATLPYYWNIAPNRDATISPRILSKRGLLLGNEFRYLEPTFNGRARFEILPNDREERDTRHSYFLQHAHNFGNNWAGSLNLQGVSDDDYFVDLSNRISLTSLTNLPREGTLTYSGEWWNFVSRIQTFQVLQDPLAPIVEPYERVPQLVLNGSRLDYNGFDLRAGNELVHFSHPDLISGTRFISYPSVSYPLQTSFAYVIPKTGLHFTRYSLEDNEVFPNRTRAVPISSLDAGVIFERDGALFGENFTQTLEPRLYYVYIPFREQDEIPIFDTALADINFTQIYSENQFSGGDRINDANQVTVGVTTRLLESSSGLERVRATVAQRFAFQDNRVTLPGIPQERDRNSDLLAAISGALTPAITIYTGLQYNTDLPQTERFNIGGRFSPELGKVLNLSYRFDREAFEQYDISAQWPITSRWIGLGRYNYSIRDDRLIEGLAGFEYNGGCWVMRLVAHTFVTATQERRDSFFVQLELSGVSQLGPNPLDLLKENISGYTRLDPRPQYEDPLFD
ncbi:MAG: LPS-assembly protein LptD [Burkholderiales bacterium]